ncbi:hypothetical protein V6Z11_A09G022900 [Gossypium hirsutum]
MALQRRSMMPLDPSNFDFQRRGQRSMADLQGSSVQRSEERHARKKPCEETARETQPLGTVLACSRSFWCLAAGIPFEFGLFGLGVYEFGLKLYLG